MTELRITSDGKTYTFQPGQIVRIGRSPENNVVVSDPTVSREHAFLVVTADGWIFEDIGKDRTFIGGQPLSRKAVGESMEFRLAAPDGPALLIQAVAAPAPQPVRVPDLQRVQEHEARLAHVPQPPPQVGAAAQDPARPAGPADPRPAVPGQRQPLQPAGAMAPVSGLGAAIHILVPLKSWLSDPGWRQWSRLLVIVYGILPAAYLVLFANATKLSTPGWAYSLYIAPLWAIAFWHLIRPGKLTAPIIWVAVGIIAAVQILMPTLTIWWETAANVTTTHNLIPWIYGVGYPEEVTKALPVLAAALILLMGFHVKLNVRAWMFLGTIAGLAFGVNEAVGYTSGYLYSLSHNQIGPLNLVWGFAERVFVDGFGHAVWAGISGFFIGMGVNYRRRRIPLILFGVTLPAVLHGLNDWSITTFQNQWVWIGVQAISLLLFLGYTMSAASIERQVRKTPMFRGDSMLLDPASSLIEPGGT